MEVLGRSQVAVYDGQKIADRAHSFHGVHSSTEGFCLLNHGDRFDLTSRERITEAHSSNGSEI